MQVSMRVDGVEGSLEWKKVGSLKVCSWGQRGGYLSLRCSFTKGNQRKRETRKNRF